MPMTPRLNSLALTAHLTFSVGWFVIVPFSVAALLTGLVQSPGTRWGLLQHG